MNLHLFDIIEILGTIAFAISATFTALDRKLDWFGVITIAFVTAMGGGTLRDILIGNTPVFWMRDVFYCYLILGASIGTILFKSFLHNFKNTLFLFDAMGLGLFTVIGIEKAMVVGLDPAICIALGTMTGSFGGVLRDVLLNRVPLIFRKEIYATACVLGGLLYFFQLKMNVNTDFLAIITIVFIVLLRIVAVKYNLSLPTQWMRASSDIEDKS